MAVARKMQISRICFFLDINTSLLSTRHHRAAPAQKSCGPSMKNSCSVLQNGAVQADGFPRLPRGQRSKLLLWECAVKGEFPLCPYRLELPPLYPSESGRAGVVQDMKALSEYPWTGHSVSADRVKRDWQETDSILAYFGKRKKLARRGYEKGL